MQTNQKIKEALVQRDGLRCSISGENVQSIDDLRVEHVIPRSQGGSDDLDNLVLVSADLNQTFARSERQRRHLLFEQLKRRQEALAKQEKALFERENLYRRQLEKQQEKLDDLRQTMQAQHMRREEAFHLEIDKQRKLLAKREEDLANQLQENQVAFDRRLQDLEREKESLMEEILRREVKLQKAEAELLSEKQKYDEETKKRVESKAVGYVADAISHLETAVTEHRKSFCRWSVFGVSMLLLAILIAAIFAHDQMKVLDGIQIFTWPYVVFLSLKGLVFVALLVALATSCFSYSRSFMHESLKCRERIHAIKFGRFYLESYGVNADWAQVKEAFEHWNIAPPSAFSAEVQSKHEAGTSGRLSRVVERVVTGKMGENQVR